MGKTVTSKSLSLLRLLVENRVRRRAMVKIIQEEWNAVSSFLDDFGEENWNALDALSKQKKAIEEEIVSLEREIIASVEQLDLHYVEELVAKEENGDVMSGNESSLDAGREVVRCED